jgi:hypothetical protein
MQINVFTKNNELKNVSLEFNKESLNFDGVQVQYDDILIFAKCSHLPLPEHELEAIRVLEQENSINQVDDDDSIDATTDATTDALDDSPKDPYVYFQVQSNDNEQLVEYWLIPTDSSIDNLYSLLVLHLNASTKACFEDAEE